MSNDIRSRDAVAEKFAELQEMERPETPDDEHGVYGLNVAGLKHDGKLSVLEWLLDGWRSERDVYLRYRRLRNTGTTCDRRGAKTSTRMRGEQEIIEWVLQTESPDDPESLYDRVDAVNDELLQLTTDVYPENPENLVESGAELPNSDVEVDTQQVHDELDDARRILSDVLIHLLNGASISRSNE